MGAYPPLPPPSPLRLIPPCAPPAWPIREDVAFASLALRWRATSSVRDRARGEGEPHRRPGGSSESRGSHGQGRLMMVSPFRPLHPSLHPSHSHARCTGCFPPAGRILPGLVARGVVRLRLELRTCERRGEARSARGATPHTAHGLSTQIRQEYAWTRMETTNRVSESQKPWLDHRVVQAAATIFLARGERLPTGMTAAEVHAELVDAAASAFSKYDPALGESLSRFLERAVEWRFSDLFKRRVRANGRTRPLTARDAEELAAPDDVLAEVAERDELAVLKAWCAGQGRAGELLWRRLLAETAVELAEEFGLSVSEVRKILAVHRDVAQKRFSG